MRTLRAEHTMEGCAIPLSVRTHGQPDLELHRHDFTELVIVVEGEGAHMLDQSVFPISAGDVFVIDENHSHGYRDSSGLRIVNVLFDEPFLLRRAPALAGLAGYQALVHLEPTARQRLLFEGKLRLSGEARRYVTERVFALMTELEERREGYEPLALSVLVELFVILCRLYSESETPAHRELTGIGRVVSYLERNYHDEVDLATLRRLVPMSPRTLIRRFGEATGTTPVQYLLRVRISQAIRLLTTTSRSITEVAFDVGFNDANYFTRQFHQIAGVTPTEYRRRHLHEITPISSPR